MTNVTGHKILEQARRLAFPRYPGTEGDRRAIDFVVEHFRAAGLDVEVEEFSYDLSNVWLVLRVMLAASALAVVSAGLVALNRPAVALLGLGGTALLAVSLLGWSPWLERLYAGEGATRTANVVGRRREADPRRTLVLLAHHDSKSQNLTMLVRGLLTVVALVSAIAVAVIAVSVVAGSRGAVPAWVPVLFGISGSASLAVLSTLRSGNESPGGVDNAGSLAVLLELAASLPTAISEQTELIFLSTGAEEDHMVGAMRWLDRHRNELARRPTMALNMDGVGSPGRLVLLERYGFGRRLSPTLSRLAREVSVDLGLEPRGVLMPPAMGIDAIPFVNRGIECLTLSSGSLDRATLSVHSRRDLAEHLSAEVLAQAYAVAFEIVRLLDADRAAAPR